MSDVTQLLEAAAAGDGKAAAELLPLFYNELLVLAAVGMVGEAPGQTLDASALIDEAYLRLVGGQQFDGRGHFFAAAAEAMRRVLVDRARDKRRHKPSDAVTTRRRPPERRRKSSGSRWRSTSAACCSTRPTTLT